MTLHSSIDEPPEPAAYPVVEGWAPVQVVNPVQTPDPEAASTLEAWLKAIHVLEARHLSAATRQRLQDCGRICEELAGVLAGVEPGEGKAAERTLHFALIRGRIQAVSSMFACPRGTFIELLVTAPWNVLGRDDPADPRTVRGAGTALVKQAIQRSWHRGCRGRVALQAENVRTLPFYERLGFYRMSPADRPLTLVPPGEKGWSPSIVRVALGQPGPEEETSPWLVLDPSQSRNDAPPAHAA